MRLEKLENVTPPASSSSCLRRAKKNPKNKKQLGHTTTRRCQDAALLRSQRSRSPWEGSAHCPLARAAWPVRPHALGRAAPQLTCGAWACPAARSPAPTATRLASCLLPPQAAAGTPFHRGPRLPWLALCFVLRGHRPGCWWGQRSVSISATPTASATPPLPATKSRCPTLVQGHSPKLGSPRGLGDPGVALALGAAGVVGAPGDWAGAARPRGGLGLRLIPGPGAGVVVDVVVVDVLRGLPAHEAPGPEEGAAGWDGHGGQGAPRRGQRTVRLEVVAVVVVRGARAGAVAAHTRGLAAGGLEDPGQVVVQDGLRVLLVAAGWQEAKRVWRGPCLP